MRALSELADAVEDILSVKEPGFVRLIFRHPHTDSVPLLAWASKRRLRFIYEDPALCHSFVYAHQP